MGNSQKKKKVGFWGCHDEGFYGLRGLSFLLLANGMRAQVYLACVALAHCDSCSKKDRRLCDDRILARPVLVVCQLLAPSTPFCWPAPASISGRKYLPGTRSSALCG